MIRFTLPLALVFAFPVHAQTDSPAEPASWECTRLRIEIANAENAKRGADVPRRARPS